MLFTTNQSEDNQTTPHPEGNQEKINFDFLASEATEKNKLSEYYSLYKYSTFFSALCIVGVILPFLLPMKPSVRIIFAICSALVFGVISFYFNEEHKEKTNYSVFDNKVDKIYKSLFPQKKGCLYYLYNIITIPIIVALFINSDWKSAFAILLTFGIIYYSFETFKAGGFVFTIIFFCILSFATESGITDYILSKSNTYVSEINDSYFSDESTDTSTDEIVKITDAYLSEHNGRPTVVICYNWTNTSSDSQSAIYSVSVHVYQNDIELEKSYFSDENDELLMRNIRPGKSVNIEESFYLDDGFSDIFVEITPWVSFDDEVYVSERFTINQ